MKIRSKIILVVLPLIIVTLALAEGASYVTAARGISRMARSLMMNCSFPVSMLG